MADIVRSILTDPNIALVVSLWFGGLILAMARWMQRPRIEAISVASLLAWSGVSFASGQAIQAWLPAAALAATYGCLVAIVRSRDTLTRILAARRVQAVLFLTVGPLLTFGWLLQDDRGQDVVPNLSQVTETSALSDPTSVALLAYTDMHKPIPLALRPADEIDASQINRTEHRFGQVHSFALIRTAEADTTTNCHGWVFTAGRYWVRNETVESILADNAYREVSSPQLGDLILYRDVHGKVSHTGLVRLVADEQVLIESKWGPMGRFIHPPGEQPYGEHFTFHRSSRSGHLLRIGESYPGPLASEWVPVDTANVP